jgi:putative ABC transport system permease protein
MRLAQQLRLAARLLARDARAGELKLFLVALVIAVGAVTAVGFLNDRVKGAVNTQSAELLGADLVLTSPQPAAPAWLVQARTHGLTSTAAIEFPSVVVHGERLQLASIRAVQAPFPLRGAVRTAPDLYAPDTATAELPAPGTVWADSRLLLALALKIGERVEIGNATFIVARVLTYEPGRGGNFFGFAPRLWMPLADVERTGVIQPGSRVTYAAGFTGSEAAVNAFRGWLKPQLVAGQQLLGVREGNSTIVRAIDRVERYVGLTSLAAVVLAGVAIAMGARRFSERHFDTVAMWRCLGCTQRDILLLFLPQLLLLGLIASALGAALGWLAQAILVFLLGDFFPVPLPAPSLAPVWFGLVTGLVLLAGFAAPPLLRLKNVAPLRVLRRELTPLPAAAWLVYGAALAAILLLLWQTTHSARLTLGVFGGGLAATLLLGLVAAGLLRWMRRLHRRVGVAWRFGINNLWRRARASVGQLLAFGVTLMAMAVMALVRGDLLASWQAQLPAHTPNHFAFNILPEDVAPLERFFREHAIPAQALYPLVRGRLTHINAVPVTQAVTKEDNNVEALQRELNLTWAEALPPDNRIEAGAWWAPGEREARVSVEGKLAQKLGIQPGDELTFTIGGGELKARVASLRFVQWDSFHPNFYMIFPPGLLDAFPATYLTSFHLTPAQKPLLASLVRAFPAATVLETDQVLAQVRAILGQVTAAVEFMLLFVLAAGFAVLAAALTLSLDERLHEGALLRTLGASRRQLRAAQLGEFVALGLAAGVLAALGTELIAYVLYARVFELDYQFKAWVWLAAPLAGAILIGTAGFVGTRAVVTQTPMAVLREL